MRFRGIVILGIVVLLGLSSMSVSADTLFLNSTPQEDRAQKIFNAIQAGVLPVIPDSTKIAYYTGPCVGLSSSVNPIGSHYAILAVRKQDGVFTTAWTISYDNSDTPSPNPYLGISYDRAVRLYPPKRTAVLEENHLRTNVSEEPLLYYIFAADAANPARKLYAAGLHIGPMYCELDAIDF